MRWLIAAVLLAVVALGSAAVAANNPPSPQQIDVPITERPFIAVVSFDDGSLKRESWWGANWDVGSGLADMLATELLGRNRFRLVERSLLNAVMQEQDLGASGRVNPQTAAKIGKVIGADYFIMGKVTMFSWDTRSTGAIANLGHLAGIGASKTKARVAVDLRIVDTETSEILGSFNGKGEDSRSSLDVGYSSIGAFAIGSQDFTNTILGTATRNSIVNWADNFCRGLDNKKPELTPKHLPAMHPDGVVLNVDDRTIISNTGSIKCYAVGDKVEIRRKSKELKDPDTGEVLKVLSDLVANGTVTKVEEKTAEITFTPVDSAKPPVDGDLVVFAGAAS